jgi:hypothetical protein
MGSVDEYIQQTIVQNAIQREGELSNRHMGSHLMQGASEKQTNAKKNI